MIIMDFLFGLQTVNPITTFSTASRSDITLDNLEACMSYWVVVSAVDCNSRTQSAPQLITTYMTATQGKEDVQGDITKLFHVSYILVIRPSSSVR